MINIDNDNVYSDNAHKDSGLISVIMPVYNCEGTLRRAAESILSQSHGDMELILVDDGSTDGSREVCRDLVDSYDRVTAIRELNKGPAAARNRGLEVARGQYIGFMDGDDIALPRMYELLLSDLESTGADIAVCGFEGVEEPAESPASMAVTAGSAVAMTAAPGRLNSSGQQGQHNSACHGQNHRQSQAPELLTDRAVMERRLVDKYRGFGWSLWNKLYRAELLRDIRFDESLHICEDLRFNAEAIARANILSLRKDRLYLYNTGSEGLSKAPDTGHYVAAAEAIDDTLPLLTDREAADRLRAEGLAQLLMGAETALLMGRQSELRGIRKLCQGRASKAAERYLRADEKLLLRALLASRGAYSAIYHMELPLKLLMGGGVLYKRHKRKA